jgi:hypothetical protein
MTYAEQLKSPKWQKLRLEVLQHDNFTCKICGSKDKQLHVHHGAYIPGYKVWDYDPWLLHTLCYECHSHTEGCLFEMNYSIANMMPSEENISFITRIANNINLLSDDNKKAIENILNMAFDIEYLKSQIKNNK